MISRSVSETAQATPEELGVDGWLAVLQKAAAQASALGESFELLQKGFDQTIEGLTKAQATALAEPPSEASGSGEHSKPNTESAAPTVAATEFAPSEAAGQSQAPSSVSATTQQDQAGSASLPMPVRAEDEANSSGASPSESALPAGKSHAAPTVTEETMEMASRVNDMARQVQNDQAGANAIYESLTEALALMNQIAGQAVAQSELRELAAEVETLRHTVNNLQTRAGINRLP